MQGIRVLRAMMVAPNGSERGPVALPVFKTGRPPLTRGGWVRLPGASAINLLSSLHFLISDRPSPQCLHD